MYRSLPVSQRLLPRLLAASLEAHTRVSIKKMSLRLWTETKKCQSWLLFRSQVRIRSEFQLSFVSNSTVFSLNTEAACVYPLLLLSTGNFHADK